VSERPKEHASKACVGETTVGSNPTATASSVSLRRSRRVGLPPGTTKGPGIGPGPSSLPIGQLTLTVTFFDTAVAVDVPA
jgi:hypothetical protein